MAKNKCNMCGHNNPKDNFRCEAEDCGVPLDLRNNYKRLGATRNKLIWKERSE